MSSRGEAGPVSSHRLRSRMLLPVAAAVVTLLLRLPFAADRLWDHDSVQFALAAVEFDLAAHQPHPPGYPLYVGILQALARFGVSALAAMVGLSVGFQALGAALVVRVAARLVGERQRPREAVAAGLLAASLYATSPLIWFYGELPLVYGVEAGLTVLLAWAALGIGDSRRRFLLACVLFGLAGGIRPSTLVLLAPLFVLGLALAWSGGRRRSPALAATRSWRPGPVDLATGGALGAVAVALWLVPLTHAAGGWSAYRRIGGEHFAALLPHTSILYGAGWPALAHNLEVLTKWTLQGLLPAAVVAGALAITAPRETIAGLRRVAARSLWLIAWAGPALAFFALFHVTKAGYTLIDLPALLVAVSLVAAPALASRPVRLAVGVLGAAVVGGGLFLFGADRPADQPRWTAVVRHEHNAGAIAAYERDLDALVATLEALPAERTLLAALELSGTGGASARGFLYPYHRHLQWYAPQSPVALLVPEEAFALWSPGGRRAFRPTGAVLELPVGIDRVVFVLAALPGERLRLPPGEVLLANPTFVVVATPLGEGLEVGPLRLLPAAADRRAA